MTTTPSAVWVRPARLRPSRLAAEFYRQEYTELEDQLDRSGHKLVVLGELGRLFTGPFGSKLPASLYDTPNGIPLLRVQNIGDLFLDETDLARIPLEVHEDIHRSKLEPGDLALAKAGRLGALSKIPAHIQECNITQHIVGVKVRADKVRGSYLAAFFLSRFGSFQFKRQGIGTLIKYLGIEETRAAKVVVPERGVQDYIGAKVELAERCRAVATQCESKSSDLLRDGLGQSTDDILKTLPAEGILPTGAFATVVDADLLRNRLDPSGYHPTLIALQAWASTKKNRFIPLRKLVTAETSKRSRVGKNCSFFVSVLHLNDRGFLDEDGARAYRPESGGREARSMDVLVSCINPAANRIGVCNFGSEVGGCSPEFSILRARNGVDPNYVAFALRTDLCRTQLLHLGRGTSSSRRRVDESELLDVLVPTVECASAVAKTVRRGHVLSAASIRLTNEAKADVEALIDGTLDVQAILAGTLRPPTADDIPELAEDGA